MKKLFVVALAALGMVACVNEDVLETPKSDAIAFAGFVDNATRANDPSFDRDNLGAFDVWAFMNESDGTVFAGEDVEKSGNTWGYTNIQYWLPLNSYYFAALAPMNSNNWEVALAEGEAAKAGIGTVTFTNVDGSEDLIYAKQYVETPEMSVLLEKGMDAVKLQFGHLLSKVKFTFVNKFMTDNAYVSVENIKMTVPAKGRINLTDGSKWASEGELVLNFGSTEKIAMSDNDDCTDERLTIPALQDYKVTFDVKVYMGEQVGMEALAKTTTISGLELESGKAYNFVAEITPENLHLKPIEFEVEVVDGWTPAGETNIPCQIVNNAAELQAILNKAAAGEESDYNIVLGNDIEGDVTVAQCANTAITIDGAGKNFKGVILVDGKSQTYTSAALTIKNVNFNADAISADAIIRMGNGTTATRYICNLTVEGCTFDVPGAVGVKSYTGGDKNLVIKDCVATDKAHSLVQVKGLDTILIEGCEIYSKNGMNFNNSVNVVINDCTADVKGYAARFGEGGGNGVAEVYAIKNSNLKSAVAESGDAVIILRGSADKATLTIENTTLEGEPQVINNAAGATVTVDGFPYGAVVVTTAADLTAALAVAGEKTIALAADKFEGIYKMTDNTTILGYNAEVGAIDLDGADNVTLKDITFEAANAGVACDGTGKGLRYANIYSGGASNPKTGARNLVIDGCVFNGAFSSTYYGCAIAFTDQKRTSGQSGDITIKNCVFDQEWSAYDIYVYYSGYGSMLIENNTFKGSYVGGPIYLGRYQSNTPVVVTGNTFETVDSQANAMYIQAHSAEYTVSIDASNNTYAE